MIEFASLFAFVLALGAFLLGSRRTVSAAVIFAALGAMVAAGLVEMRSRSKPINMEWRTVEWADVLWYRLDEGQALYFILQMPDFPRFYVMPWDQDRGKQLLEAGKEAETTGGILRMNKPFEPSLAPNERLFYAAPQPSPPAK